MNSEEDGYLVFKIPFENGWKIYVDGQEQEIEKADLGFQGVKISAGSHSLHLEFTPPLLAEGLKASAVFWILFLVFAAQFYYDKRKTKKN